jgi:hypothetical protein
MVKSKGRSESGNSARVDVPRAHSLAKVLNVNILHASNSVLDSEMKCRGKMQRLAKFQLVIILMQMTVLLNMKPSPRGITPEAHIGSAIAELINFHLLASA